MTASAAPPPAATTIDHEALFYRGSEEFLAGVIDFVRGGLEDDEAVVVAEPAPQLALLRDALGDDAEAVEFLDMAEIGLNPARIIGVWAAVVDRHLTTGRGLRGVGEPAYPGRRPGELAECELHERLLNHRFDRGPAWRLLCPYDEKNLPRGVVAGALRTHPVRTRATGRAVSEAYEPEGHAAAFALPLARPTEAVLTGEFGPKEVTATRRTVAHYARSCGLSEDQVHNLELAASELATNSIRHGGGTGTLAMWLEPGAVVVEFSDGGVLTDPLVGRAAPPPDQEGGQGLYLVNQLCDLVQLRSSAAGTTIRVTTWR